MPRVQSDEQLRTKLLDYETAVEIVGDKGEILATVLPGPREDKQHPQVSEEELDRRQHSKEKRYTTAEVLAHLEKL
jgi:hypothetical protein